MLLYRLRDALRRNALQKKLAEARALEEFGEPKKASLIYVELKSGRILDPEVFAEEAAFWTRLKRSWDAEMMLAAVLTRFPASERIWVDYAAFAERRRDWNEACRRWNDVRVRFPYLSRGHTGLAEALRQLGKLAEADTVLGTARELWSKDGEIAVVYASLAAERKDWAEADVRWASVRAAFPDRLEAYTEGAKAACSYDPHEPACEIMVRALKHFPRSPAVLGACAEIAAALSRARRFDEAEKLLAATLDAFPSDARVWMDYAQAAERRQDWTAAVQRWQEVRKRFSDRTDGYYSGILALRRAANPDDAEKLAVDATRHFPDDFRFWHEYALSAHLRRDWDEAIRRYAALRDKFPNQPEGYSAAASSLVQTNRYSEAEALFEIAAGFLPQDERIAVGRAWNACHLRDWPSAVRRCAALRERFPRNADGYAAGALALRRDRRPGEAEELAAAGMELFPKSVAVMVQFAWCAEERRDREDAMRRWEAVLAIDPANRMALGVISEARQAM